MVCTSLLQLSRSSVVATAVYAELKDQLPSSMQSPERLLRYVVAEVPLSEDERFSSNIIRVTVTTTDPAVSAMLANSWAHHMVDFINGLYGEVPETTIVSVTAERDDAFSEYQAAQVAYENFIADNQIDSLNRQIQQKNRVRDEIMTNYTRMLTALVSSEYNTRLDLYETLAASPVAYAVAMISAQSEGTVRLLKNLYVHRASTAAQLSQARSMEESLVVGGEAAAKSNVAALQLLKLRAFAAMYDGNSNLLCSSDTSSLAAVDMTLDEQLIDVRALIEVLEKSVVQLDDDIAQLAESGMVGANLDAVGGLENGVDASMSDGAELTPLERISAAYAQLLEPDGLLNQAPVDVDPTVSDAHEAMLEKLESEIHSLQATVSAESAVQRELTHRRDLAWTTYDTVSNKLEELRLLRSSANTEVRIGNPALVPIAPEPLESPLMPVVAITLIAFFLAVVLAFSVEGLGGNPFFSRRTA